MDTTDVATAEFTHHYTAASRATLQNAAEENMQAIGRATGSMVGGIQMSFEDNEGERTITVRASGTPHLVAQFAALFREAKWKQKKQVRIRSTTSSRYTPVYENIYTNQNGPVSTPSRYGALTHTAATYHIPCRTGEIRNENTLRGLPYDEEAAFAYGIFQTALHDGIGFKNAADIASRKVRQVNMKQRLIEMFVADELQNAIIDSKNSATQADLREFGITTYISAAEPIFGNDPPKDRESPKEYVERMKRMHKRVRDAARLTVDKLLLRYKHIREKRGGYRRTYKNRDH
jgi:hypothetical protein